MSGSGKIKNLTPRPQILRRRARPFPRCSVSTFSGAAGERPRFMNKSFEKHYLKECFLRLATARLDWALSRYSEGWPAEWILGKLQENAEQTKADMKHDREIYYLWEEWKNYYSDKCKEEKEFREITENPGPLSSSDGIDRKKYWENVWEPLSLSWAHLMASDGWPCSWIAETVVNLPEEFEAFLQNQKKGGAK